VNLKRVWHSLENINGKALRYYSLLFDIFCLKRKEERKEYIENKIYTL